MAMEMGDKVFGRVSVAVVTPFMDSSVDSEQPVDLDAVESMVVHVATGLAAARQVHGLVGGIIMSGTTGEQHTMTIEERSSLYELAVSVASRFNIPIAAGIASTTFSGVIKLTRAALTAGCQGIMLGLPPYCRLGDEEIRTYVLAVKALVPANFPILLYNNVMRNGYGPSLDLLAELCRSGTIWGIKHAVLPDDFMPQAQKLLALEPSARLYTGSDKLSVDLLNFGKPAPAPAPVPGSADATTTDVPRFYGLTSIMGNIFPEEVAHMICELTSAGDDDAVQRGTARHTRLLPVIDAVLLGSSLPVGLKFALRYRNLPGGFTRQPVGFLPESKHMEIAEALQRYHAWS